MLQETISKFLQGISTRDKKLEAKVQELQEQVSSIKNQIAKEMKNLIAVELSEDKEGQRSINAKIKALRIELADLEDRSEAFKNVKIDLTFTRDEINSMKKTALKSREERLSEYREKDQKCKAIEKQIESLEKELYELKVPMPYLLIDKESSMLVDVLQYIDVRAAKLPSHSQKEFVSSWLNDRDTEYLFKEYE